MTLEETFQQITTYGDMFFAQLFTKIIVAVVILLIGFIIGRIVGKVIHKFLHEIELNTLVRKAGIKAEVEKKASKAATYFIYFITVIWALNEIGIATTILNMVSGAALILIVISIALAIKDFIPNAIAGFIIYRKDLIKVGDRIELGRIKGKVIAISLIETQIKSKGDIIHIPHISSTTKELRIKQ